MPARHRNPANRCPSSRARPACPSLPAGNWRRPAPRVRTTRKVTTHEPTPSLSLRPSSPASRSFVLAPLRALQLDPGSSRRARQPRGQPPTAPTSTAQRPPLRGDSLDKTTGFTDADPGRFGQRSQIRSLRLGSGAIVDFLAIRDWSLASESVLSPADVLVAQLPAARS